VLRTVDGVMMLARDTGRTRQSTTDNWVVQLTLTQLRTTWTVVIHLNIKHHSVGN